MRLQYLFTGMKVNESDVGCMRFVIMHIVIMHYFSGMQENGEPVSNIYGFTGWSGVYHLPAAHPIYLDIPNVRSISFTRTISRCGSPASIRPSDVVRNLCP
jgi:hypothetical protein